MTAFKNIRVLPSGYQVSVVREGTEFSKHFAGHSPRSLREANAYRDLLLRTLPSKRRKNVPKHILDALKLKEQVVGVFRYDDRRFYQVTYSDRDGVVRTKTFSWKDRDGEVKAYRDAVKFRRTSRPPARGGKKKAKKTSAKR